MRSDDQLTPPARIMRVAVYANHEKKGSEESTGFDRHNIIHDIIIISDVNLWLQLTSFT